MKLRTRRRVTIFVLPLLTVQLVACGYWQAQPGQLRDILADQGVEKVRLTANTGETIEARVAEVRGDSIYGTRGTTGPLTCDRADPACNLRMPISDVGHVELRKFSAIKTAALIIVPATIIILVAVGSRCTPLQGNC